MPQLALRPYASPDDLTTLMQAASAWGTPTDFCGTLHPGYLAHLYSTDLSDHDPADHLFLVENEAGVLVGMVLINRPSMTSYDLLVHPSERGGELESALIAFAEQKTRKVLQLAGVSDSSIAIEVMNCDTIRRELLFQAGYERHEPFLLYSTRSLLDPIPESVLPEGFTIRSPAGVHEADLLMEVHNGAFNANWQPGEYAKVMQAPGYTLDQELIVVTPDGRFAAFLLYYLDPVSKIGLFEPIGCHPDFRRKGLTRALMYEGMRRMVAQGMTMVMLKHEIATQNPASAALYASTGFTLKYVIEDFRKITVG